MKHSALSTSGLSARNRRILALGVHGGADDDALDLDQLLGRVDGIADLSDEDVAALLGDLTAACELILDEGGDEAIERSDRVFAAIDAVRTTQTEREAEATRIEGEIAERRERLNAVNADPDPEADPAADPDPDPNADPADDPDAPPADPDAPPADPDADPAPEADAPPVPEADADPDAQPLAASGRTPVASRVAARRPASTAPRNRPQRAHPASVLRASANSGMPAGEVLDTPEKIMRAFDNAAQLSRGYGGAATKVPVMSLGASPETVYGEQRTLTHNERENERKIEAITSGRALRASGGICAPPPVDYTLPVLGSDARPVKDVLARFGADRGGVRLLPAVTLADVDGSVGIWTHANDLDPSDPATKPCAVLDCPDDVETLVDAITRCLTIGNFRARYFPEQVQAWTTKVGQLMARTAEIKNLTKIGANSTQVTAGGVILGSTRTVLREIGLLAAGMRSRRRLERTFPLRLIGPQWLMDNLVEDLAAEQPGSTDERLATAAAKIESFFGARNINVTWSMDGEVTTIAEDQIFGAQVNGALNGWPSVVRLYLFVEGTWLHLDGGTLDFGLVRDSSLNATNDFQLFSEIFENVAFHGEESFRLDLDICANGGTAAPVDTSDLCDVS